MKNAFVQRPLGKVPLILASGSAARSALLAASGLSFETCPVDLDEEALRRDCRVQGLDMGQTALALAEAKARHVSMQASSEAIVIGADQILDLDGVAFRKPETVQDARTHLLRLRGCSHTLQTAVTLYRNGYRIWHEVVCPRLTMRLFSDVFLDNYLLAEGETLLGCVGAYRFEGRGVQLFSAIDGDHDAIMGLPRLGLMQALRQEGVLLV